MDTHMSNDEFFSRLADLLASYKNKDHGSVFLQQKKFSYEAKKRAKRPADPSTSDLGSFDTMFPDLQPSEPYPVLIRATNGMSKARRAKKIKLSTVVQRSDLQAFYTRYAEVCKTGMIFLKPRDRSKRKEKLKKRKKAAAKEEA